MSDSPKRRWYQFSLRTLLVVMLVACFAFAWIGSRMRQARQNRDRVAAVEDAVAAIGELHGGVTSSYEERRPPTWLERQFDDPGSADDPVGVLEVTAVSFVGASVIDDDLKHLKGLTGLEDLCLVGTQVTDAGLEHLKGLKNLQVLELAGTKVTDEGVKKLQRALPKCKIIQVSPFSGIF